MASRVFNCFIRANAAGEIDLNADDIRVALLMTNTNADTVAQSAVDFVDDITTLDEMDGSGYVRKALATEAVNRDDANNRAEFDADDVVWTALGAGTRAMQGALVFKFVTDDTASIPIAWIEFSSPVTADGTDFTIQWNAEGILQLTGTG